MKQNRIELDDVKEEEDKLKSMKKTDTAGDLKVNLENEYTCTQCDQSFRSKRF